MRNRKRVCTIDDIAIINRGKSKHRPRGDSVLYGGQYPFIQTSEIKKSVLHITEFENTYNETGLAQSKLWKKGTLCLTIAANIAETGILDFDACFPDSVVGILPYDNVADVIYVKYMMDMFKVYMQQISKGTTQDNLSLEKIRKVKFEIPTYEEQIKISSILKTYDCLIENNNKRIKILEQMALELYKEWFVRFRYDSKEIEYQESNLGMIPSTFNVVPIGELIDYYIGGGWGNDTKSDEYCEEAFVIRGADFPNVRIGDISTTPLRFHKKSNYDKRKLLPGDIVIEISGGTEEKPVGRTILITDELLTEFSYSVICASFCKLIRLSKEKISPIYLHYWMNYMYETRMIDRFQLQSTGIINFKFEYFLRKGLVLIPPKDLMVEFERKIKILKKQIDSLSIKNSNLREQRDLLLPRLMSGKLEVKESE